MSTEGAVEMVRRGYTEETRCLGFRVDFFNDLDGVVDAIRVIDAYNEFAADRVVAAVNNLLPYLEPFQRISVGREGSPALYITLARVADAVPNRDEVIAGVQAKVENILREAAADEISFEGYEGMVVRAWWD